MIDNMFEHPWRTGVVLSFFVFTLWMYFFELPRFVVIREAEPAAAVVRGGSMADEDIQYPVGLIGVYSENRKLAASNVRYISSYAKGLDGIKEIWPLLLFVSIAVGSVSGISGYALRGNINAAQHKRELAGMENFYKFEVEVGQRKYAEAEIMVQNARYRDNESRRREKQAEIRISDMTNIMSEIEAKAAESVEAIEKKFKHLQEDHKNRGQALDRLKEEKTELKLENTALKKEKLTLAEENLKMSEQIHAFNAK